MYSIDNFLLDPDPNPSELEHDYLSQGRNSSVLKTRQLQKF